MFNRTKTAGIAAILATTVSGAAFAEDTLAIERNNLGVAPGAADTVLNETTAEVGDTSTLSAGDAALANARTDSAEPDMGRVLSDWTYAEVASSLSNGTALNFDMDPMKTDARVSTTTVSELKVGVDDDGADEALDRAIQGASAELATVHEMIGGNPSLKAAIEANGYMTNDVIGVYSNANGGMDILIDDRS